jgi:pyrroline-5-carboxylate reductase
MYRLIASTARNQRAFAPFLRSELAASSPRKFFFSSQAKGVKEGLFGKIACIGTGQMAQALIEPMVLGGIQPAEDLYVYDVSSKSMQKVHEKLGVQMTDSLSEVVDGADLIICAVKPQNLTEGFFNELKKGNIKKETIFLSIIAGKPIEVFEQEGGFHKVVRSMPNTPAQVGEGMTVWSCSDTLTIKDRESIHKVLESCGESK